MKNRIKECIIDVVERHGGIPIHKIAEESSVSIATASKYCYILEAEGRIKITSFGNMKLVSKSTAIDDDVIRSVLLGTREVARP